MQLVVSYKFPRTDQIQLLFNSIVNLLLCKELIENKNCIVMTEIVNVLLLKRCWRHGSAQFVVASTGDAVYCSDQYSETVPLSSLTFLLLEKTCCKVHTNSVSLQDYIELIASAIRVREAIFCVSAVLVCHHTALLKNLYF